MMKFESQWLVCGVLLLLTGCAVTEPTEMDRARVSSAIEAEPTRTIQSLSRELGVSELAVVKALPEEMACAWTDTPQAAWAAICEWDIVGLSMMRTAASLEVLGDPKAIEVIPGWDGLQVPGRTTIGLDWREIESVWLLRKPTVQGECDAVWFFDATGVPLLHIRIFDVTEESVERFNSMWGRHSD